MHPNSTRAIGTIILILSILSIFIGGGFLIGFIIGIIGSAIGITWKPKLTQVTVKREERDQTSTRDFLKHLR